MDKNTVAAAATAYAKTAMSDKDFEKNATARKVVESDFIAGVDWLLGHLEKTRKNFAVATLIPDDVNEVARQIYQGNEKLLAEKGMSTTVIIRKPSGHDMFVGLATNLPAVDLWETLGKLQTGLSNAIKSGKTDGQKIVEKIKKENHPKELPN